MRHWTDKYAKLALQFQIKPPLLWELADYLESQDNGKHEQHLLMLASKWIKNAKSSPIRS